MKAILTIHLLIIIIMNQNEVLIYRGKFRFFQIQCFRFLVFCLPVLSCDFLPWVVCQGWPLSSLSAKLGSQAVWSGACGKLHSSPSPEAAAGCRGQKARHPDRGQDEKKKDPIWFTYHFAISCFCMDVLERPEADFILAQISHYEWQTHRSDAFDQIILAVMTSTFTAMNGKQLLATWHQFLIDNRTGTDDYDPKWLNC